MYINHITLSTGHNICTSRAEVDDETLVVVAPWLIGIVNSRQYHPLPVPSLNHYSAIAYVQDGGLLITVSAPNVPHQQGKEANAAIPLVTFGVAQRSRQGNPLWAMMLANFGGKNGIKQPDAPWCAVSVHPSIMTHFEVMEWIADFERCCAWAWITRKPSLETIKNG